MKKEFNISKDNLICNEITSPKIIKIAYLILVHRLPLQFKRLFNAIYDSDNYYLIHIDKKASHKIGKEIATFLAIYPNVFISTSENITWGGYSMVQAELDGIKFLLNINADWDYFINLSGQDYPLKSQRKIREFLTQNRGNNYILFANQKVSRPETMNRIENLFEELDDKVSMISNNRPYLKNVVPYIGGQWMILTRSCCQFICNSTEVEKFENYYINTLIPDESFFQTVLMNTSFDGVLINDDKRAIIWIPDGNIKLRPKTFTQEDYGFLQIGENLFARKFDDNVDANIINKLKFYGNLKIDFEAINHTKIVTNILQIN